MPIYKCSTAASGRPLNEQTELKVSKDAGSRSKNPSIKVTCPGTQSGHEAALSPLGKIASTQNILYIPFNIRS